MAQHLACPSCGGTQLDRFRSPKMVKGRLYRRHQCRACRRISLSVHGIVTGAAAERLLEDFEALVTPET